MSRTLAETKDLLRCAQQAVEDHMAECPCRHVVKRRRPACEERDALQAEVKRLRTEVKTWFDPSPADPTLF